ELVIAAIDVYPARIEHRAHCAIEQVNAVFGNDVSKIFHSSNRKYLRVGFREEDSVQFAHSIPDVVLIYYERDVNLGGALADHVDVDLDIPQRLEDFGCDTRRKLQILAHDTHNGFIPLDGHFPNRRKVAIDRFEPLGVIQGHRYRNLRSRHDIDGCLVTVKDGEDRAQKSIGLEHSG